MSVPLSPSSEGSIDDLDLSILKQVKIAINRVADTQQDLDRRQEQALQSSELHNFVIIVVRLSRPVLSYYITLYEV